MHVTPCFGWPATDCHSDYLCSSVWCVLCPGIYVCCLSISRVEHWLSCHRLHKQSPRASFGLRGLIRCSWSLMTIHDPEPRLKRFLPNHHQTSLGDMACFQRAADVVPREQRNLRSFASTTRKWWRSTTPGIKRRGHCSPKSGWKNFRYVK